MIGGEAKRGIRVECAGFRKPPVLQHKHLLPGHALLAATAQGVPPEPQQAMPESAQAADVSRDRVVVEVALHDRLEPFASLTHRIVHALAKLLFDLSQFTPHALTDRQAPHRESSQSVLPADVREPQKVERLRLPFSSTFPVLFGKPAELDPARLVWVQFQSKHGES